MWVNLSNKISGHLLKRIDRSQLAFECFVVSFISSVVVACSPAQASPRDVSQEIKETLAQISFDELSFLCGKNCKKKLLRHKCMGFKRVKQPWQLIPERVKTTQHTSTTHLGGLQICTSEKHRIDPDTPSYARAWWFNAKMQSVLSFGLLDFSRLQTSWMSCTKCYFAAFWNFFKKTNCRWKLFMKPKWKLK